MAKLWQFLGKSPKTRIFLKKKQSGDQEKLLKNRPRSTPRFKGPRALWRKRHYPLICIHLYCKDWKKILAHKAALKVPNGQVMAIFPRSPKTRFFCKRAKGGPGKFLKIAQKVTLV